jgi:TRAP-type C4-dicarboxylate transport system permease small subunit
MNRIFQKFNSIIAHLSRFLAVLSGVITGLIMLAITADVVGRYVFNSPIHGVFEGVENGIPAILAMGAAYGQVTHTHPAMVFIAERFIGTQRAVMEAVILLVSTVAMGLLTWFTTTQAVNSFLIKEAAFGIVNVPIYPSKIGMAFAFGLLALVYFLDFIKCFNNIIVKAGKQDAA